MYLVFSVFTPRWTPLLASIKVSVFFFMVPCYLPTELYYQHRPEADVSHSNSVPPGFCGHS
jgi:hypothetical protein